MQDLGRLKSFCLSSMAQQSSERRCREISTISRLKKGGKVFRYQRKQSIYMDNVLPGRYVYFLVKTLYIIWGEPVYIVRDYEIGTSLVNPTSRNEEQIPPIKIPFKDLAETGSKSLYRSFGYRIGRVAFRVMKALRSWIKEEKEHSANV